MLIVKNFEKLKTHGFKESDVFENLWVKKIEPLDSNVDNGIFELVVNPIFDCAENEVLMYVYANTSDKHGRVEVDVLMGFDEIFEMLIDGTIKYVPREVVDYGKTGTDG